MLLCAKYNVTEEWLKKKAEEAGVKIYCLSDYVLQCNLEIKFPPTVIWGAGMDMADVEKGIAELIKVWDL